MRKLLFAAVLAAATSASANAQTTVVTGDGTTTTTANCTGATNTWCASEVRAGTSVGITENYARSGNGSLYFNQANGTSKADYRYLFAAPIALSEVSSLSFDYFRDALSDNPANQAPAIRLLIGNSTGTYGGFLIYEPVYHGVATIPEGSWQTATIGASTNLWLRQSSPNGQTLESFNITLAQWQSAQGVTAFGNLYNGDLRVYGINVGTGSGWNGVFEGAVDNVSYRTTSMQQAVNFNFEVASTTVPEPSTYVLMASGLLGLFVAHRRRRNA